MTVHHGTVEVIVDGSKMANGCTLREKTMREVFMVLAMVVAWYANISLSPGVVMWPGEALSLGDTIQSIGSASSLPYRLVPCATRRSACHKICS